MKKVLVIIPCYHAAPFIQRALDSALDQTYKDFDIVCIIDDCYADDTVDIIRNHAINELHTVHMHIRDYKTSPAAARNVGLNDALTRNSYLYVAFLDADDEWRSFHLQDAIYTMDKCNADLYYAMCQNIVHGVKEDLHGRPVHTIHTRCPAPFSTVVVSTRFAHIKFNESLSGSDDYEWLLRLYDNHKAKFVFNAEVTSTYYIHGNNVTGGHVTGVLQLFRVFIVRKEYLGLMRCILGHFTLSSFDRLIRRYRPRFMRGWYRLECYR